MTELTALVLDKAACSPMARSPRRRRWLLTWTLFGLALVSVGAFCRLNTGAASRPGHPAIRPIEQVQVGDRVRADNPTGERDTRLGEEVDPATWRKIELRASKKDGTFAEV